MDKDCTFCKIGEEGLLKKLPLKSGGDKTIDCKRCVDSDKYSIATLAPEQYTKGHTIVVFWNKQLKKHKRDLTDNFSDKELCGFIKAIHKISKRLKRKLRAKRVYVGILCDGVEHLHAHLVPRYKFRDEDKKNYEKQFKERDGMDKVYEDIKNGEMGGFWYIAEREKNYKESKFWRKSDKRRAKDLERLAKKVKR